jgi:alpha,alpha-trehalase
MLFYLFSSEELRQLFRHIGCPFTYETIPKNIDYYLKRTAHGSSLSRVVHAWVLARSDRERSWKLFEEALKVDISDVQGGTTAEGIHLGAMACTVDLLQRAHTGIEVRGDVLYVNPCLPTELKRLDMCIYYRSHSLDLQLTQTTVKILSRAGKAPSIKIRISNKTRRLKPGDAIEVNCLHR